MKLVGLLNAECDHRLRDSSGRTPSQYIQNEYLWKIWISALENAGRDITNETRRPVHLRVSIPFRESDYIFPTYFVQYAATSILHITIYRVHDCWFYVYIGRSLPISFHDPSYLRG